ncbi:MAG: bifunctional ornithine acetyltransferase/N-acetylglutamate synthase [Actinomycetota bacterium]
MTAGLKPRGRPDLGLLVADRPCSSAGLFTTNTFAAALVRLSQRRLAGGVVQACPRQQRASQRRDRDRWGEGRGGGHGGRGAGATSPSGPCRGPTGRP